MKNSNPSLIGLKKFKEGVEFLRDGWEIVKFISTCACEIVGGQIVTCAKEIKESVQTFFKLVNKFWLCVLTLSLLVELNLKP